MLFKHQISKNFYFLSLYTLKLSLSGFLVEKTLVTPLAEVTVVTDLKQLRLRSILPIKSKILEKLVYRKLLDFLPSVQSELR